MVSVVKDHAPHDSSVSSSSLSAAAGAAPKLPQHEEEEEVATISSATMAPTNTTIINDNNQLHAEWTFWFDNPRMAPNGADWQESLRNVGSFATVDLFWCIFNNLKPTDSLASNSNYSLFRKGVEPSWEDPANRDGGKFVLTLTKKEAKNGKVDELWLYTVLAMIGETMDDTGDRVNGAVVSVRKNQDRIALWIKTTDRDACTMIGERWKKVLRLENEKMTIRYQTHRDAAATGHSFRNEVQFQV